MLLSVFTGMCRLGDVSPRVSPGNKPRNSGNTPESIEIQIRNSKFETSSKFKEENSEIWNPASDFFLGFRICFGFRHSDFRFEDYLPFFAPYLLRLRLRPSTPSASRVPRMMW